ncbi:MAG: hypothetical protein AMJ93_06045, partial [Anaerolineae bacterium SM23_84]
MAADPLFAQVVVRSPLGRKVTSWRQREAGAPSPANLQQTFHYSVPAHLRDGIVVGQLVWVPFGARELAGIVLALSTSSPVAQTRDIKHIVDPWPVLTPYQIELMHWVSQYYHTPLHRVAWGMFPPGISWRTETMVHLQEAAEGAVSPSQEEQRVLDLLHERGPMSVARMERRLRRIKRFRSLLDRMSRKGWLRQQVEVRGPQVKPKTETVVRLLALPEEKDLAALSRARRQREVLVYLRQRSQNAGTLPLVISLAELCAETGVTRGVVERLAKLDLLELDQRELRRDPLAGREFVTTVPPKFTADQELAWQQLAGAL